MREKAFDIFCQSFNNELRTLGMTGYIKNFCSIPLEKRSRIYIYIFMDKTYIQRKQFVL